MFPCIFSNFILSYGCSYEELTLNRESGFFLFKILITEFISLDERRGEVGCNIKK